MDSVGVATVAATEAVTGPAASVCELLLDGVGVLTSTPTETGPPPSEIEIP